MTSRRPSTFARSWRARLEQMYSRVPDRVDDLLVRGGRVLQRMRSRKTPVAKVVYPDGFRLLVAGRSPLLSYFVCRGGDGPTRVERLPSVAKRRLHSALEHYSSQADAIIAQDPCEAGQTRLDPRYLQIPGGVESSMATPADLEAHFRLNSRHARNIQIARKSRLTWRFSQQESDFDSWYDEFYVPTVNQRFGDLGLVRSWHRLRRLFRHGGILWIEHDGEYYGGDLVRFANDALFFVAGGEKQDDSKKRVRGVGPAGYMAKIEFAKQLGLQYIHMGVSRPSLQDGVLQFKKGWGSTIHEAELCDDDVQLRWDRFDQGVAKFLLRTAPIVRGRSGLAGVTVGPERVDCGSATRKLEATRSLAVPGLHSLVSVSADPAAARDLTANEPDAIQRATLVAATSMDVAAVLGWPP